MWRWKEVKAKTQKGERNTKGEEGAQTVKKNQLEKKNFKIKKAQLLFKKIFFIEKVN